MVANGIHVVAIYWSSGTIYPDGPDAGAVDTMVGSGGQDGSLIGAFLRGLGGSPWFAINRGYWDNLGDGGTRRFVGAGLIYDGFWADGTSAPSGSASVPDLIVRSEIIAGFQSGRLALRPDTVYAIFSAGGVNLGGGAFTQYCGYHRHFSYRGTDVLYAVMPYDAFSARCSVQPLGPNADPADAEVNILAHEIAEATTDPDFDAWYDTDGRENADKCLWTFGATRTAANGARYNLTLDGRQYLVQQNWRNRGRGSCVMS